MEKLLSNRLHIQALPESYILPPEKRANIIPKYTSIPVIDLGKVGQDRKAIVQEIIKASSEFGFFQVMNHGVPETMIKDMMEVAEEFFEMPIEDRMPMFSDDPKQISRLYSSIDYDNEETHFWRDSLRHPVYPVETYKHSWPSKPANYREVAATYSMAVRSLGMILLELIGEGLGLGSSYFRDELTKIQLLSINYYPPCPDPSLTLGLPRHTDPHLLTLLVQDMSGLQVHKEGEWIAAEPLPNSFTINIGHQLQIISNGLLQSAEHRVVTNSKVSRTSLATFLYPSMSCTIQPAEELIDEANPPKFKAFKFQEFHKVYRSFAADSERTLKEFHRECCK